MWTTYNLSYTNVYVLSRGVAGPVFLWPFYPHRGNELEHMEEVVDADLAGREFTIVAFEVEDWNRDLSPWRAPGLMEGETFEGGGTRLVHLLENEIVPWTKLKYTEAKVYLMGYSLAGLFAMWVLYESACFDGAVCCSSSFWLEGWQEYANVHKLRKHSVVYLSLGGKEEKTRNQRMAKVGDRTREMEKMLRADPLVERCTLVMNSGGHFADSAKRLVKGMQYVLGGNR
ncbi:MAG: alpha/beta hydrolase [Dorea sp.]|nr:alpha/beta hydrolase [Dorea sp.]